MSPRRRVAPQSRAAAVGALFAAITGCAAPSTPAPPAAPEEWPVTVPAPESPTLFPTTATGAPDEVRIVHPGAYCDLEGAHGTSPNGRAMRCRLKPGEERPRWRRP